MPAGYDVTDTFDAAGQKPCFISFSKEARQLFQPNPVAGGLPVPKLSKDDTPMFEDVDFVTVRQPGGIDSVIYEAKDWLERIVPLELHSKRIPQEVADYYKKAYERFKQGQEAPVAGVPLTEWSGVTKAQIQMLTGMHIRTVEELADLPDDSVRRIGMGGVDLKFRARKYLASGKSNEKMLEEINLLKAKLDELTKDKKK